MPDICQTCLKTGYNVTEMTITEINLFNDFICKTINDRCGTGSICAFCRCLLWKLIRFIEQCQASQHLLKEEFQQNSKSEFRAVAFLNLQQTAPAVVYVGPESTTIEELCVDGGSSAEAAGDSPRSDDEDDVPLVMLKSGDETSADGGEQIVGVETEENGHQVIKTAYERKRKRNKKEKKQLREGFTSRMVQETNEYLVIKLSKEQVLQELALNAKAEKYMMAPYKCEKCVKGFNFEDVLNSHMEKHSPKHGILQCDLCTQYCASAVSLRGHMKSHTTRYKCKICGIVRLSRQHVLEHHAIAHTAGAPAYTCDRCGFTTNKRTVIQHHVRTHAPREPHACHRCGKLYKNLETLRIHVTRHETQKRHPCAQCKLSFVYASQLQRHVRSVHERRDYYCVECDVIFKSTDTLKLHFQKARRHRDASSYKYKCSECDDRFISQSTLSTHTSAAHGAPKRVQCAICPAPRAYSGRDALRVHVRRAHAQPPAPSLQCPLCARAFTRKSVLAAHVRTHTGERPHACADCGAAFAQPASLRAHRAARHRPPATHTRSSEENGFVATAPVGNR